MPTLGGILRFLPGLRFVDARDEQAYAARTVAGVWPADHGLGPDRTRDLLVVARGNEPWLSGRQAADQALRRLARGGAAALALRGRAAAVDGAHELTSAARRHRVPLLTIPSDLPWGHLAQSVSDLRLHEARAHTDRLERLLTAIGRDRQTRPEALLAWLADAADATASLLEPHVPPRAEAEPRIPAQTLAALRGGALATASLASGPWTARVYAVGPAAPYHVLVVVRRGPFPPAAVRAVEQVLPLLAWAVELSLADTMAHAGVRVALLQLLMGGQVLLAQRTAHALALGPLALYADEIRVCLLDCPPGRRDSVAAVCRHALGDEVLVARCPVEDGHLVVLVPTAEAGKEDRTAEALGHIVAGDPDLTLGRSAPLPPSRTAQGYEQATRALVVAHNSAGRTAEYEERPDLALVLGPAAHRWAERLLHPLERLPAASRQETVDAVRLALRFGVGGGARLSGLHRNTIRARVARMAELLDLDLRRFADRAVLDLALRVRDLPAPREPGDGGTLAELLRTPAAREWAAAFLAPLDADSRRDLRRTLTAWAASDAHTETAAARLGLHYKTVLLHLVAAERLLECALLGQHRQATRSGEPAIEYAGGHDVAFALHITGAEPAALPARLVT